MRSQKTLERGQALILIALAAIALFAIAGVAIDGSAKFSDRRHAQNAADTAALAGALGLANEETTACGTREQWECDALLRAEENGYDDFTNNEVWVFRCDEPVANREDAPLDCRSYEGNPKYISVIIRSYVNTLFARVIGINRTTNLVQAVTFTRKGGPMFNGASIASYNPDTSSGCSGSFRVGGGSTISLTGGGIWLNSDEPDCALEQQGGCPTNGDPLLVINGGGISSAGTNNVDFDACVTTLPSISYGNTQLVIPEDVDMPEVPDQCSQSPVGNKNQGQTTLLHEGYYPKFPPVNSKNTVSLSPGIYCIDESFSWSGANFKITGTDVTLFIKKGYGFRINGGDTIQLSATSDPDSEYKGFLIIVDTDFSGSPATCIVNGGSYLTLSGTIFAPFCDVQINGDNNSATPANFGTQVVGWNVQLNGSSTINFNYIPGDNAQNQKRVGLMK